MIESHDTAFESLCSGICSMGNVLSKVPSAVEEIACEEHCVACTTDHKFDWFWSHSWNREGNVRGREFILNYFTMTAIFENGRIEQFEAPY